MTIHPETRRGDGKAAQTNFRLWKRDWILPLALFLVLRLVASALGYGIASGPDPEPLASGPIYAAAATLLKADRLSHLFVNVWFRWDTGWYLKIAAFGYEYLDGTASFAPLYPWLAGVLGGWTGNYLASALLLSSLAALAVYILLYEVARVEGLAPEQALFSVFFLAFSPSAFFLFAAYTESLFLALVLGTWLAARRGRWLAAGLLGGLATLARLQGVVLAPVLLLSWLAASNPGFRLFEPAAWKRAIGSLRRPAWLYTLFPALTFAGWNIYLQLSGLGSLTETYAVVWGIHTVPPWQGLWIFLERVWTAPPAFINYVDLLAFFSTVVLLLIGLRPSRDGSRAALHPGLSLFAWSTLGFLFVRDMPVHLLDSFNRYMLIVFPTFLLLGQVRSRAGRIALWVLSLALQTLLLMGFLDWRWIA